MKSPTGGSQFLYLAQGFGIKELKGVVLMRPMIHLLDSGLELEVMERHTDNEIQLLLDELKQHEWDTSWRVAKELARIGEPAVPYLIKALSHEDGYVRAAAADALGKIGDARAVEPLIAAMQYHDDRTYEDGEDSEARCNAAEALGEIGDLRAVDDLIRVACGKDMLLASYAIDSLGMLGDERSIPTLVAALKITDIDVPKAARSALARFGTPAVLPLIESLQSAKGYWRVYAVKALGAIGDPRATATIKALLTDADESVRYHAAAALEQLQRKENGDDGLDPKRG